MICLLGMRSIFHNVCQEQWREAGISKVGVCVKAQNLLEFDGGVEAKLLAFKRFLRFLPKITQF